MDKAKLYAEIVKDNNSEDYLLTFPEEMVKSLDWQPGDTLHWEKIENGFFITNLSADQRKSQ